jgi:tetratricopeptide (TPR) repeat protein
MLQTLDAYNESREFDSTLASYPSFSKKCTAKDAKWKGGTALARAYNGLEKHTEASEAASNAIKANKNWIEAYFERAVAYAGLGQIRESKADYERIVELSAKNQDQKSRATIYAMLADISLKQGEQDSAFLQIEQAITMDPQPSYFVQKGDMYYKLNDYDNAFAEYDKAVAAGKNDYQMFAIRASQRLRIYQKKYATENVNQLASKMTPQEKRLVCLELDKLKSFGKKNMKLDMTHVFLCE